MGRTMSGAKRHSMPAVLAGIALLAPPAAAGAVSVETPAAKTAAAHPSATTLGASRIMGTSALLTAAITPSGEAASYYFEYGTTAAYGLRTPTVAVTVPAGTTTVRVGQTVIRLTPGTLYYFRVVAFTPLHPAGTLSALTGTYHTFTAKPTALTLTLEKTPPETYGTPFMMSGRLSGTGNAGQEIVLQESPFPYLEAFSSIGVPAVTNASGSFSFRVANVSASTQFQASTLTPLPLFSPIVTVLIAPRVTLHVRSSGVPGLVRLYGTISPAANGALVRLQVQKAVRPGKSEVTERWTTQFSTTARKAGGKTSRFSTVVKILHGGLYRAYVKLSAGRLASGPSVNTIIVHA